MKLRNKKTGGDSRVQDTSLYGRRKYSYQYDSLAELNEEWEDVPTEEVWYLGERIGNYSMPKKEARKATEKILAWKRLKDKGFKFTGWQHDITNQKYIITMEEKGLEEWVVGRKKEDLDLLFGGEE